MTKLTYTDNGIIFGDIKTIGHKTGGFADKANYTVDGSNANSLKGGEIDGIFQTFNAIDIDWNGANLGNYVNIDANGGTSEGNSAVINTICELIYQ